MFVHRARSLVVLALIAACLGCTSSINQSGKQASGPTSAKGTIGVSVLTLENPFFRVIGDSLKAELKKAGYEATVVSGDFDPERQGQQVNDFLTAQCAAIVLCPCNSQAVGSVIERANAKGVPVFTADIANLSSTGKVVSHIATDNLGGGRQAGAAMIEALGEAGGKVVILDFKSAESCILRVRGFKEVIARHNEGRASGTIDIVAEYPGEGKKDRGDRAAQDALQAHPDLAGIFAINDPSALGAIAALEKARKLDQVKIVAFDGQPEGKQAIKEGKIFADPIQHPDQIGVQTAQTIIKYLNGEEVPAEQLIPTGLYKREDALKDSELQ